MLSASQRHVLAVVILATAKGKWIRATRSGERVTLASLHRAGLVLRRAWRGAEGEADAAHEYKATHQVMAAWQERYGS